MSVVKRHALVTFFIRTHAIAWGFLPVEAVRFVAGVREPVVPPTIAGGISIDTGGFLA